MRIVLPAISLLAPLLPIAACCCMHSVSSVRKRHSEEMPRYTALSTAEELATSCRPRRHASQAGGLLPRLFGHVLFCYTCVMSTLLCPLLALVLRPVAPLLPRPIRGASLFRLVALLWHWSLGIQPLPPLDDAGGVTYLCNHRSMADCYVDIWQCDATVVIRQLAAAVSLLGTVAGLVTMALLTPALTPAPALTRPLP